MTTVYSSRLASCLSVEEGETTCDCGKHVQSGKCETDIDIRDNVCPVTCKRRREVTCVEPPSYPHATPSSDRRYFATLNYTCQPGYINEGGAGTMYCTLNGTWVRDVMKIGVPPQCKQAAVFTSAFTKITFPETYLEVAYVNDVRAQSSVTCAQSCAVLSDCTHYIFKKPETCTLYNDHGSNLVNVTTSVVWRRNLVKP
ncbi:uncharacterized protein LOC121387171 [Gigantopelta aegis]|uniref:uncharacterized protein LOC121387171 n=1 Tax=Gigantopelta aegis TaxID=1735272 RepID=UPI001B88E6DD|nr:uncharacterized protein LOC121387171 [Gigantopelta aegis]